MDPLEMRKVTQTIVYACFLPYWNIQNMFEQLSSLCLGLRFRVYSSDLISLTRNLLWLQIRKDRISRQVPLWKSYFYLIALLTVIDSDLYYLSEWGVCLVPSHTWLWCQGDGKHVGSGNYSGSKHFSWMISFVTAGELGERASGRRIIW